MPTDTADWGTIAEAAAALRVTPRTIRNMIARGDLEARRFGPKLIRVNLASMAAKARPLQYAG